MYTSLPGRGSSNSLASMGESTSLQVHVRQDSSTSASSAHSAGQTNQASQDSHSSVATATDEGASATVCTRAPTGAGVGVTGGKSGGEGNGSSGGQMPSGALAGILVTSRANTAPMDISTIVAKSDVASVGQKPTSGSLVSADGQQPESSASFKGPFATTDLLPSASAALNEKVDPYISMLVRG
ncbi:unnamed protein product [Protopolystoma xenopodis]|uniref:Uncharacterized protein n=1 Tax=Protopolystoma xenopodis TaxID=117903 RepID=A0A448WC12_9PLAT|nr:unnamed protein product [Protopolystoma xenopodis]